MKATMAILIGVAVMTTALEVPITRRTQDLENPFALAPPFSDVQGMEVALELLGSCAEAMEQCHESDKCRASFSSPSMEDVKLPIPLQCDTLWTFWRSLFPDAGATAPGAALSKCAVTFLGSAVGLNKCGDISAADTTNADTADIVGTDVVTLAEDEMELESGGDAGFVTALQRRSVGGKAVSGDVDSVQQFVQQVLAGAAAVVAYIIAIVTEILHRA